MFSSGLTASGEPLGTPRCETNRGGGVDQNQPSGAFRIGRRERASRSGPTLAKPADNCPLPNPRRPGPAPDVSPCRSSSVVTRDTVRHGRSRACRRRIRRRDPTSGFRNRSDRRGGPQPQLDAMVRQARDHRRGQAGPTPHDLVRRMWTSPEPGIPGLRKHSGCTTEVLLERGLATAMDPIVASFVNRHARPAPSVPE
jgi:hypothetical protein